MSYSIIPRPKWDKFRSTHKGYPIWFRIKVGDAPPFFKKTDLYVESKEQWNRSAKKVRLHKNAEAMNTALAQMRIEMREKIINEQADSKELSREAVKGKKVPGFFEYARQIRGDNTTTNTILNRIEKVFGREPRFSEITPEWCRRLELKMRTEAIPESKKRKGRLKSVDKAKAAYSETTINITLRLIRRIQTVALREGYMKKKALGVGAHEIPKEAKHDAVWLVCEERERWRDGMVNHVLEDPEMHKVLVYFMLGCYAGLRISDWYRFNFTRIIDDSIVLRTHKTDGNVVYPINGSLRLVLNEIAKVGPLTFPEAKVRSHLKEIGKLDYFNTGKEITPHVARHSYGRLMAEETVLETDCAIFMGISTKVVKEVYYHISNKDRRDRYK